MLLEGPTRYSGGSSDLESQLGSMPQPPRFIMTSQWSGNITRAATMIPAGTAQSHRNNFLEVDISGVSVSGLISKAAELLPLFELCFAW